MGQKNNETIIIINKKNPLLLALGGKIVFWLDLIYRLIPSRTWFSFKNCPIFRNWSKLRCRWISQFMARSVGRKTPTWEEKEQISVLFFTGFGLSCFVRFDWKACKICKIKWNTIIKCLAHHDFNQEMRNLIIRWHLWCDYSLALVQKILHFR